VEKPDELNDLDRNALYWDILDDLTGTYDPERWPIPAETSEGILRRLHDGFRVMRETYARESRGRRPRVEEERIRDPQNPPDRDP
jgi:hypothetical protein